MAIPPLQWILITCIQELPPTASSLPKRLSGGTGLLPSPYPK